MGQTKQQITMDYKEKYEQALSRARQFSEKPYLEDSAGIVEYIFHELAELKDERIMKALIHFFSNDENTSFEYWEGIPKAEVLAWLKKQGQVKESLIFQHENKTCKENNDSLTCEDNIEQKSSDKVKPKFHEGYWVFVEEIKGYKQGPFQIKSLSKHGYCFDEDRVMSFSTEDLMSLWTIQDAKDGDVLHCWIDGDEFVLIYKGIRDEYITTYGHLYQKLKSFSEEPTSMFCRTIQGHFTPATEEQRNALIKVMADAGYIFDFEKKELKKISQRMISAEAKEAMYDKPAWSEEDEKILAQIEVAVLCRPSQREDTRLKCLNWLKSIRPQNRWKPSEGQMEALDYAISNIRICTREQMDNIRSLYDDLKKITTHDL